MIFLRKLFKLPSPRDLGWNEYDALPMREFTPDCEGYTWEDWHEKMKRAYPIKYFFSETLPLKITRWVRPIKELYYWLTCHLLPSRKYHLLDLRKSSHGYKYGYRDPSEKMLYAMFSLLKEYIDSKPYDLSEDFSLEEINADPGMKIQFEKFEEAKQILFWWEFSYKKEEEDRYELFSSKEISAEEFLFLERESDSKTEEMLIKLIKIRNHLWN